MKVDVSEIKALRKCHKHWEYSSRNKFHLRNTVTPKAYMIGTVFHESLHKLYVGRSMEHVQSYIEDELRTYYEGFDEVDSKEHSYDLRMLTNMISGYYENVLPSDLEEYKVLDIEYHFNLDPQRYTDKTITSDIELVGSIDMVVVRKSDNTIWGFEHKTAKTYRSSVYAWLDEQPRVYYVALQEYVKKLNRKSDEKYTLGGVFINEVKKLVQKFDYCRTELSYKPKESRLFMEQFVDSCIECAELVESDKPQTAYPDMMKCGMCNYATICMKHGFDDMSATDIVASMEGAFKIRERDHLEDK